MTDTTTLAPCPFCGGEAEEMMGLVGCEPCALARRDIASWNRRAPAPVAQAPQPAPMPYPTDAQIDAVYEQTMSQPLRSQDAPAVRRFGRAMFFYAWNSATQAAPAPQPTVPEGYVLVPVEPTQEMEAAAYRNSSTYGGGPGADYRAMIAAAPKADQIEDGLAMVPAPLQPDWCELRRLHALAVADADADRILAEWRAYKPAPLQQGEYLPCPFCGNVSINLTVIDDRSFIMCNSCGACCDSIDTLPEDEPGDVWNRRAARAQAAQPEGGA